MTVWISRRADAVIASDLRVDADGSLAGLRLGVKDNIDVAGLPTTAGCPAFSYEPESSATVVERLTSAGAVVVGKTNLDQFATGLVGTRSPHGALESPIAPGHVSGGSSSGSAVAVANGEVDIALGTDTAGSGRVPAAFCGVVGIKPTPGWLPRRGVVPASETFDCVSVFARDVATASLAVEAAGGEDPTDPTSTRVPTTLAPEPVHTLGRPDRSVLEQWCTPVVVEAFEACAERARDEGYSVHEVDLGPYFDAGDLLYDGAFVAERYDAVGEFIDAHPDEVDPTVRSIISAAGRLPAHAFAHDLRSLRGIRRRAVATWDAVDALLLPTTPDHPTLAAVAADPIRTNASLGRFTNGCNLLGWCATAFPAGARSDGLPFGATLLGPAWHDRPVWDVAARLTTDAAWVEGGLVPAVGTR